MTAAGDRGDARYARLDVLKAAVTALVVFHHTAITYGGSGGWFYIERPPDDSLSSLLLTILCAVDQAWFMGFFFLLAGRFTPGSIDRKGAGAFLRDRALRLGVPWLVFGLVLGPITIAWARTAQGQPFVDTLTALWLRGTFEPGPLWFAQALMAMALVVLVRRRLRPPGPGRAAALPSDRQLLVAAFGVGTAAFALRLAWPVGTEVWHLQLGYFASYLVLFAAGCAAADAGWFERLDAVQVRRWRRIAWIALPTLLPLALLAQAVPAFQPAPTGGWNLPSLMYAFWEPFVAWGLLMGLVAWAMRPGAPMPPVWQQRWARRAYGIFVIHPLAVVGVALAWRAVAAPPLLKWAVTGVLAWLACHLLVGVLLRIPAVRRVL
jgi:hypothetical protein